MNKNTLELSWPDLGKCNIKFSGQYYAQIKFIKTMEISISIPT